MPNIIPAGWFAWLAENLMRASATVENPNLQASRAGSVRYTLNASRRSYSGMENDSPRV